MKKVLALALFVAMVLTMCFGIATAQAAHAHSFKVVSTKAPTCTADGSVSLKCSCGATTTATITKLGHVSNSSSATYKPATCTTPGYYKATAYCSRCHKDYVTVSETYRPTGHTMVVYARIGGNCKVGDKFYLKCNKSGCKYTTSLYGAVDPNNHGSISRVKGHEYCDICGKCVD